MSQIAYTSRLGYLSVQEALHGLQFEVWEAITFENFLGSTPSIEDLARLIDRKESSICGRIDELRKLEAIEEGPFKLSRCGRQVKTYRARVYRAEPEPVAPPQMSLFGEAK